MRFNFRRATLPDDAIAAGGCCWEKRGMAFWGNSFSVFFSVRSFIPAVADVRGFLQEDDGGGDGFGDVSDALDGADDEEQVDVEGLLFLCLRSDEAAQGFAVGLVQLLVAQSHFPRRFHVLRFQAFHGVPEFGDGHVQQGEDDVRGKGFLPLDGSFGMPGDVGDFLCAFAELVRTAGEGENQAQVGAEGVELDEDGGAEGKNLARFFIQQFIVRNDAVGSVHVRIRDDMFQYGHVVQQAFADAVDACLDVVQGQIVVGEDVVAGMWCHDGGRRSDGCRDQLKRPVM